MGGAVTGAQPGEHVVGVGSGAFAEYAVLPAAAAMPVPPGWTDQQALGLVVNWPTAVAALRHLGGVTAGQTVLVHAAAGATGQAAVTVAKHVGATVIASAALGKHEMVSASGADHVLDSRRQDIAVEVLRLTDGAGVDVVLESAGGATFEASLAAAKRVTGRVVVVGVAGGEAPITNWDLVYRHQVLGVVRRADHAVAVRQQLPPEPLGLGGEPVLIFCGRLRGSGHPALLRAPGPACRRWTCFPAPRALSGHRPSRTRSDGRGRAHPR